MTVPQKMRGAMQRDFLRAWRNASGEWLMTFDQWASVWGLKWTSRNNRMAIIRKDPTKPWMIGNVELRLISDINREARRRAKDRKRQALRDIDEAVKAAKRRPT